MRIRTIFCAFTMVLLTACADTAAIKKFSELRPNGAEIQETAANYDRALIDASTYDVLHTINPRAIRTLEKERGVQEKLIVANARAISQYMQELGAIAGLNTKVNQGANNGLKNGLDGLQKAGKVSAQEVSTTVALVDFVGGLIESGEQQYSLRRVIGEENHDFQSAVSLEGQILTNIQSTDETDRILLEQLKYITQSLEKKMKECRRAAGASGTASRFPGAGCAQAYAAFLTFPKWYSAQYRELDAEDALAGHLMVAFTSIGKAHQELYMRRNNLLTKATWGAIKLNVESARAAINAARKL